MVVTIASDALHRSYFRSLMKAIFLPLLMNGNFTKDNQFQMSGMRRKMEVRLLDLITAGVESSK